MEKSYLLKSICFYFGRCQAVQWHFKAWLKHSKTFWAQDTYINGSCAIYMFMKWKDVMGWICTTILCHCLVGFAICHCFPEESVQIWHARVMLCRVKRPPMPHELVYSHRRETLINLSLKKKNPSHSVSFPNQSDDIGTIQGNWKP